MRRLARGSRTPRRPHSAHQPHTTLLSVCCRVCSRSKGPECFGAFRLCWSKFSSTARASTHAPVPGRKALNHVARLFGTDGVRGLANQDITAELALDLSVAAAHVLGEVGAFNGHRPVAVVGRDPRASGEFLAAATVAGLASAGIDVRDAGVLPTPAIAYLVGEQDADLGAMLSASHNPMPDNGIKFFARGGHKLADDLEDRIEARLRDEWQRPTGGDVGRITPLLDGADRYVAHLLSVLPHRLEGLHVVIDAAHGAAFEVA